MCGISGIVNLKKDKPPAVEVLKKMNQVLAHRGPDDEGIYSDNYAGLAVRRLSIIDLNTGHQPIHNEDESIWLVLNGEIYNYKELRIELEGCGHRFYTNTDTEVIVHAYEEYGKNSVAKLRGMFAFALWDRKRQIFILARDRLGIKPLYYSVLNDKIIFASEIKSLLQSGALKAELNLLGIDQFFSFFYVPGPQTIFQKIQKLLPGHILLSADNRVQIKEYWRLDYSKTLKVPEEECIDRLSGLLDESIQLHLRSDVPVGIFLSGGIDSSTITYLVSQQSKRAVKTFSIGFDDEEFNELDDARRVARQFKTEHYEKLITNKTFDILPEIVKHLSEPLADASIIPTYFISKMAQAHVKVILSGEGGDEMFAGYPWHRVSMVGRHYPRLPLKIRQYMAGIIRNIKTGGEEQHFYNRLRNFLLRSALPISGRYLWRVAYFNEARRPKLFSEDFKARLKKIKIDNYPFGEEQKFNDFLTAMLYYDTKFFLPDDLLAKMDQMTMTHSLEGRVPFLDHKLVEFAISLPSAMKLHNNISKYILRKIISSKVPEETLAKSKKGLMPPVKKWVNERLDDFFVPILKDKETRGRGYFNQSFIEQMIESQKKRQIDYSYHILSLVIFELWIQMHLS